MTGAPAPVFRRGEAFDAAVRVIAAAVADLAGLAMLLDMAGMTRLAAALRAKIGVVAKIDGKARPNIKMWNAQAQRIIDEEDR